MKRFVDIHSHLLPDIDDGAQTIEQTLELLTGLEAAGYGQLVTTPHLRPSDAAAARAAGREPFAAYRDRLENVQQVAAAADRSLTIDLGYELMIDEYLEPLLVDRAPIFIGSQRRYFLMEFPFTQLPPQAERFAFNFARRGFVPVLAHPERYLAVQDDEIKLAQFAEAGFLLQITMGSLAGQFGKKAERLARQAVLNGLATIVGSDLHRPVQIDTFLKGLDWLKQSIDERYFSRLLIDNPLKLLAGEPI